MILLLLDLRLLIGRIRALVFWRAKGPGVGSSRSTSSIHRTDVLAYPFLTSESMRSTSR
jgi:hypothetical protein